MKITAFNGTHKTGDSNTAVLVDHFLQGAAAEGAEIESIRLSSLKIQPCTACKACWQSTPGKCVINDDMSRLIKLFIDSDLVVLATPIYCDTITGLLKTFLDRLIPVGDPHWEFDETGESRHCRRYQKPTALVAISNCGYPEQSHFDVLRVLYRRLCRNMNIQLSGEIYRGAGALLAGTIPAFADNLKTYLSLVNQAGRETAKYGKISDNLQKQLEEPMIATADFNQMYLNKVNSMIDAMLAR